MNLNLLALGLTALANPQPRLEEAWLAASWVEQDGTCDSASKILRYNPDRSYSIENEVGVWNVDGDRLKLQQTGEVSPDGKVKSVAGESVTLRIERLSDRQMRVTWPMGDVYTFYRCG